MRKVYLLLLAAALTAGCKQNTTTSSSTSSSNNADIKKLFDQYYEDRLKLYPLEATYEGDNRFNDQLPNDQSAAFRKEVHAFLERNLDQLKTFDREKLSEEDKLSYDILFYQLNTALEGQKQGMYSESYSYPHPIYLPFNQMVSLPLIMGQLGSGTGAQPFKTVKDYDNWLKRAEAFKTWADTAVANMDAGIKKNIVWPKAIVVKIIPQMQSFVVTKPEESLFYSPVKSFPKDFSDADKKRLTAAYKKVITTALVPTYKKLHDYLQDTYLAHTRSTSGFSAMPNGSAMYAFAVMQNTTTNKTPDEIYQLGLSEVARIRSKMDSIKNKVAFKGDLKAFFEYMRTDPKFKPFKTPKEVLDAFENIHKRMEPNLKKMFTHVPKTPFEIRQTEAFRAASASAEYNQGSADGSRPGIFYVPILNAKEFNVTSGMESLFLHEAIPGHHYQISLAQENTSLPKFRRFEVDNAYVEGWALYCESLGKELGLFADPYQHMGALGDEMHRAVRLVVDVAIHTKGMTREQAIKYMMDNEAIDEQGATAEIERYMANPGQALGYKIGALKIRELRNKAEKALGSKFNIGEFHNQILKDGSMPLSVLETKINTWIESQQK
ncbi:DUF885 domain-containing protein [Mucilaginibacter sp. RS28]|uniref:DUF885 domain-containing protein n=1 Tax=Mucilaginibacter straminoryzae TaxID=2932774 RepID=A0A9X2BA76_9SPHI|nr:DUF885 domain-containing protein [Mucilaginibacter straminoryzae]MCJ8210480.1 DUF885 domain-containing protein [Mucilaginibacter straminoryzae]